MILFCGVTKEELVNLQEYDDSICVDLLIDGGTADEVLDIHEVNTWIHLLKKYKTVDYIFIDGGIYGSFNTLEDKEKICNIIQNFCKKALLIYGEHVLKRFYTVGVRSGKDLLKRNHNLPFTYIPVKQYSMSNFDNAYQKSSYLTRLQKIRVIAEYASKF